MSSFQVVRYIRRLLGVKKVGHTGTLDPGVAGILTICVGKATRVVSYLMEQKKQYIAEMTLGIATSSQDANGDTVEMDLDFKASPKQLGSVMSGFLGQIEQIPPMASALRVRGQRLYQLERQGITVQRRPRKVYIEELHINKIWPEEQFLTFGSRILFSVKCSKGTYVRTLCHDLGKALKTYGHMSFLTRVSNGPFSLQDGITLEELASKIQGKDYTFLTNIEQALPELSRITVMPTAEKRVMHGNVVYYHQLVNPPNNLSSGEEVLLFSTNNQLLAIAQVHQQENMFLHPIRVLGVVPTEIH